MACGFGMVAALLHGGEAMKRAHRRAHLLMWVILGPAIAAALVLALSVRQAPVIQPALVETNAPATPAIVDGEAQ